MLHFPDTPVGAQKRGGKLLPDRFRPRKLADNSYVANIRVIYPLVLKFELEREVVFRPAFVLPLGCPVSP